LRPHEVCGLFFSAAAGRIGPYNFGDRISASPSTQTSIFTRADRVALRKCKEER